MTARSFPTLVTALLLAAAAGAHADPLFNVTTLVSDQPGASVTDAGLVNGWGISASATGPFWVSANGSGRSMVYSVNPATGAAAKQALEVAIPGDGSVTGQAFNGTSAFNGDSFLFASEDGTVSGWRSALGTSAETLQLASDAVYKGAAFATTGGHGYLYAANFHSGAIDVLKGDVAAPALAGHFTDPGTPAGYAPFNIQLLGGQLLVAYALQAQNGPDEVAGPGLGFVDAFDLNGNFLRRVASQGALNAPWGLAIAPSSWGTLAGKLLVGNFGDGTINAYDFATGASAGPLRDANNQPLVIDGLWGLAAGNGGNGGNVNAIYFAAGPGSEAHGSFGVIGMVPLPDAVALLASGLGMLLPLRRRRQRR